MAQKEALPAIARPCGAIVAARARSLVASAAAEWRWRLAAHKGHGFLPEKPLTRRDLKQLAIFVGVALLLWQSFQASRPVGQYVGDLQTVVSIRQNQSSPRDLNPRADVTLIVFTDYQCPACRASELAMRRAVERDGRVTVVYKEWPIFGARSERAARIALASSFQGIYGVVHHALMTGKRPDEAVLRATVEQSGGEWLQLQTDLRRHRVAIEAELSRNRIQAFTLGLEGTPGYLVGPILVKGAIGESGFAKAIAAAREAERQKHKG